MHDEGGRRLGSRLAWATLAMFMVWFLGAVGGLLYDGAAGGDLGVAVAAYATWVLSPCALLTTIAATALRARALEIAAAVVSTLLLIAAASFVIWFHYELRQSSWI